MSTPNWDRLWRSAGIQFVSLLIIAYLICGDQPKVGSSPDTLISFYDGNRIRILVATFIAGMAVLNLLWFAAAIRSALRDAGQDGWGVAVTASSAVLAGVFRAYATGDADHGRDVRVLASRNDLKCAFRSRGRGNPCWFCWAVQRGRLAESGRRTVPIRDSFRPSSALHGSW